MAKKRGRNFSNYLRGSVDEALSLGTLGATTLISLIFGSVVEGRTRVSSLKATYSLHGMTPTQNRGPIHIGVAHSDYTDAEIEEWIENTGTWSRGDMVAQEISKRRIRSIGTFEIQESGTFVAMTLNDGKPIRTKLNWQLEEGQTLRLWGFNTGTVALAVTDPVVRALGNVNLWSL